MTSKTPQAADHLRIATRKSPLALWQAEYVRRMLLKHHPALAVELLPMTTEGDNLPEAAIAEAKETAAKAKNQQASPGAAGVPKPPLGAAGVKGLFVKELERALLDGRADIAVHSMKDVPMDFPAGLGLAVICERGDPHDAFVPPAFNRLAELPEGARLGTSSLRRRCQLAALRPDLRIIDLRGNVGTRLAKLEAGECDGAILAAAGLQRLALGERITHTLSLDDCLPAAGQGAVGVECRTEDIDTLRTVDCLHHQPTAVRVQAERAVSAALQGGCQVPVAAYAEMSGNQLHLRALVGETDGSRILRAERSGDPRQAEHLGMAVAQDLLAQGAEEILAACRASSSP